MLEFLVIVVLCSSFPPTEEHCIMPVNHVAQFQSKDYCIAFARALADAIPTTLNYTLRAWTCKYTGRAL